MLSQGPLGPHCWPRVPEPFCFAHLAAIKLPAHPSSHPGGYSALTWQVAGTLNPGLKRRRNEDSLLLDEPNGIVIVADGIGGHPADDVASAEAARAVQESLTSPGSASGPGERMAEAVHKANSTIWEAALEEPEQAGMGTTVTALAVMGEQWMVGHVGDSRAYLFRDGRLERLTRDHTVVQELVESGALTVSRRRRGTHCAT